MLWCPVRCTWQHPQKRHCGAAPIAIAIAILMIRPAKLRIRRVSLNRRPFFACAGTAELYGGTAGGAGTAEHCGGTASGAGLMSLGTGRPSSAKTKTCIKEQRSLAHF